MSYDVVAYSLSPAVASPEDLGPHLGKWCIVPTSVPGTRLLPPSKPFPRACLIIAWRPRKGLPDVHSILKSKDEETLNGLYARDLVFSCPLYVEQKFRVDPDELERMAEFSSPAQLKALKAARVRYSTFTTHGRNSGSLELQMALCTALAALHGGVLEDPQFGILKLFKAA